MYLPADVCDIDGLHKVLGAAKRRFGVGLDGAIHLAGSYQERLLIEETTSTFEASLRAKVVGGWNLHQLLLDEPGDLFIGFSSLTSVIGGAMVGAYAAANRYLEGLSSFQTRAGMRGYALGWSGWEGVGISRSFDRADVLEAKGLSMISGRRALASFAWRCPASRDRPSSGSTAIGARPTSDDLAPNRAAPCSLRAGFERPLLDTRASAGRGSFRS